MEIMHTILGVISLTGLFALYFMPTIIAYCRDHRNYASIFVVNLFLGWTLIGWVLSLAWSLSGAGQSASR